MPLFILLEWHRALGIDLGGQQLKLQSPKWCSVQRVFNERSTFSNRFSVASNFDISFTTRRNDSFPFRWGEKALQTTHLFPVSKKEHRATVALRPSRTMAQRCLLLSLQKIKCRICRAHDAGLLGPRRSDVATPLSLKINRHCAPECCSLRSRCDSETAPVLVKATAPLLATKNESNLI